MQGVYIEKKKLLEIIKKNRAAHADLLEKAISGYRKQVEERLNEMLNDVKNGKDVQQFVNLKEPQDHTNDYDRVIEMLEMSTANSVELDQYEFENYVRDQWEWSNFTTMTNTGYSRQ